MSGPISPRDLKLNAISDDSVGVDAIGSSGVPVALNPADTYVAQTGLTNTSNYRQVTWYPFITNLGTATKITLKIEWSEDGTNLAQQGFESIAGATATISSAEWEYTAAAGALPPIPLPVIAPGAKVSIKSDTNDATCYVRVVRQA
jgi:hypothetical protein